MRASLLPVGMRVFAAALVLALFAQLGTPSAWGRGDQLDVHRNRLNLINKKLEATRQKVQVLKRQENQAVGQLTELQQKLERTSVQLEDSQYRLNRAQTQLEASKMALGEARTRFDGEQAVAAVRLRAIYKRRQTDYWEALLTAPDLVQFITRYDYFRYIAQRDAELLNHLDTRMAELAHQKRRYGAALQTISTITENIRQQKTEIQDDTEDQAHLLARLHNEREAAEAALVQLERDSQQIEAMIRRMMAARRRMPRMGSGRLMAPVNGPIGDTFGMRYHPILHVLRPHKGLDFRVPSGAPIVAADRGVVIFSGWFGSFGKVVILDHGGDVTTLYAHCSRLVGAKGQVVNRGELIAYTGTTGLSTGPHLHFEVRVNGTPVNPLGYLR